jgi:hypothetical protein
MLRARVTAHVTKIAREFVEIDQRAFSGGANSGWANVSGWFTVPV